MADGDGSLRLLELEAGSSRRTVEFPLAGLPKCIAVHQPSTIMIIISQDRDENAPSDSVDDELHRPRSCLKLMDAASGMLLPRCTASGNTRESCLKAPKLLDRVFAHIEAL